MAKHPPQPGSGIRRFLAVSFEYARTGVIRNLSAPYALAVLVVDNRPEPKPLLAPGSVRRMGANARGLRSGVFDESEFIKTAPGHARDSCCRQSIAWLGDPSLRI